MKDIGINPGVLDPLATAQSAKKRKIEDNSPSKVQRKAPKTDNTGNQADNPVWLVPSATANSEVKWLWKTSDGSYTSPKGLILVGYNSIEHVREEAVIARDNFVESRSKAYNREYMIFIGQKRVNHLLSLDPSEEREDFLDPSLRPTAVHRPVLIRDIYKQQVAERLRFFEKYSIDYKDVLPKK